MGLGIYLVGFGEGKMGFSRKVLARENEREWEWVLRYASLTLDAFFFFDSVGGLLTRTRICTESLVTANNMLKRGRKNLFFLFYYFCKYCSRRHCQHMSNVDLSMFF